MPAAEETLRRYFGKGLVGCVDRVLAAHQGGTLRVVPSAALENAEDLAIVYTPGVGRVVTDGSAVLGLGAVSPAGVVAARAEQAVEVTVARRRDRALRPAPQGSDRDGHDDGNGE